MNRSPEEIGLLAQLACLFEATAPKPGNVSPGRPFRDMSYEDFLASALAIGGAMAAAGRHPLGTTIRAAIAETHRWTRANTNLGMVLLLAPLVRAASRMKSGLRDELRRVLGETTIADAEAVYAAIRQASPSAMGKVSAQDLKEMPTVTLREVMQLAAGRDTVAKEYVTDFKVTFEIGAPAARVARGNGLDWAEAAVHTFLTLLATVPDTLISRKLGAAESEKISRRAGKLLEIGGTVSPEGREALRQFDVDLRNAQNSRNPGTTADLTAASLFVVLLEQAPPPYVEA
jgi:triphosphoribosyl-dephospho-CoA synthase